MSDATKHGSLDVIGLIFDDADPPSALAGWHVNSPWPVAAFAAKQVTPSTPRRVFAGGQTVCYTFDSEAQFLEALAAADLSPPLPAPASVTMRQARLALAAAGKLAQIDAAIAALNEPARTAAQIEWVYSNDVQRHNGFVEALSPVLGMSAAQIDALFRAAAEL